VLSIYPVCNSSFSQQDFNYCPSINKPPFHKNGTEAGDILKQAGGLQHLAENQRNYLETPSGSDIPLPVFFIITAGTALDINIEVIVFTSLHCCA